MCRDVLGRMERGPCSLCGHVARAWDPHTSLGSTRNPLELERKGPSWANPSQPPGMARPPHPAKTTPCRPRRCVGRGWFGAGGPRAGLTTAFPQTGWFRSTGRFPSGAQPKPTHSLQSGSQTGLYSSHGPRAGGRGAQARLTHSSCPPWPPTTRVPPAPANSRAMVPELWWESPAGMAGRTLLGKAPAPGVLGLARPPLPRQPPLLTPWDPLSLGGRVGGAGGQLRFWPWDDFAGTVLGMVVNGLVGLCHACMAGWGCIDLAM